MFDLDGLPIHVWKPEEDQPAPTDAPGVVALLRAQRKAPPGRREGIRRFVQGLARKRLHLFAGFPRPKGLLGWPDKPPQVSGHTDSGVHTLEIDWTHAEHDAYWAVSEALEHGLWVADEARGVLHVNGEVLALPPPLRRLHPGHFHSMLKCWMQRVPHFVQ